MRKIRSRQGRALPVARDVLRLGSVMAMVVASYSVLFAQAPAPAPTGKTAAPAQAGSLPAARSILDKHLEAIGGRTALLPIAGFMPLEGGVPLVAGGVLVGAVGVSGVTGAQDGQCAQAGAAALTQRRP